jgi:hypothetical protein
MNQHIYFESSSDSSHNDESEDEKNTAEFKEMLMNKQVPNVRELLLLIL